MSIITSLLVDVGYVRAALASANEDEIESVAPARFVDPVRLLDDLEAEIFSKLAAHHLLRTAWYTGFAPPDEAVALQDRPATLIRTGRVVHGIQKGVDAAIISDINSLIRGGRVQSLVLVSGDSDFYDALNEARSAGMEIVVVVMDRSSRYLQEVSDHVLDLDSEKFRGHLEPRGEPSEHERAWQVVRDAVGEILSRPRLVAELAGMDDNRVPPIVDSALLHALSRRLVGRSVPFEMRRAARQELLGRATEAVAAARVATGSAGK
jgi:uncharacterized LabA/DUF88 family protein